ncbi:MAG: hypothetical protein IJF87_05965 [Erysipelotrichaceae bacterium]|nr:hypothetical protein [Erysipelotrichaceae bacterium]
MKKKSYARYKDPYGQMVKVNEHIKETYTMFAFRLHREKDKELIDVIKNRDESIASLIKKWYSAYKK